MLDSQFKETTRISTRAYCPSRKVPLDFKEIFLKEVQREDEINHAYDPMPEIPKFKKEKVEHPNWVRHLLKGTLGQLMP